MSLITHWATLTMHMSTWCLPEFTMLWAYYADFFIGCNIFYLAIIVFVFGHIANFLFQVLGAFINALRLNYVEFFSQFFMEGKGKFEAFKAKRTFTKIKN